MYDYDYRPETRVGRVCFEVSLKPFGRDKSAGSIESTARGIFEKWKPLLERADGCSVLLWTSDGSEILEYTGNPEDSFEWAKYIGLGNWDRSKTRAQITENRTLMFPIHYMENPPEMTYGDLREIISALKRVGREITGFDINVGATFDPGPEFAYSDFKFNRHPEIALGNWHEKKQWVHCASRLHADARAYAAYPGGIPEGTHIGEFLGRQFMKMREQLGFDYIWLSNGFGFSLASWDWTGELFDGERFDFADAEKIRGNIDEFWDCFTGELGDTVIETRGSNLTAGMDIAAHGCPIDRIYSRNIVAPPNSPWAAIDSRFGLELAGYMSHIAELPGHGFAFRFYSHDIWWLNSPWFDRYGRSPHDIYLPLSVARLDADCRVTKPRALEFLSVDDSFGRIPARGANEMTPHLLSAYNDYPDRAGLVTWVYPFDEYCRLGLREGRMDRIFMDDWFIESAIDFGFPLNTVISDRNFIAADKHLLLDTVLTMPVPSAGSALEKAVFDALSLGAKVLLYGSTKFASERMRSEIGVRLHGGEGLSGRLEIKTSLRTDAIEQGEYSVYLTHEPLVSGGGIDEAASGCTEVYAEVACGTEKRAYVTRKDNLVWIRGSFPHATVKSKRGGLPLLKKPAESFVPSIFMRMALSLFGITLRFYSFEVSTKLPLVLFSRCRGALMMNMFAKDSTVRMELSTPDGAPAPTECEFVVEDNCGTYGTSRWLHAECRIFIRQQKKSVIGVKREITSSYMNVDEHLVVTGLDNADVTFYPAPGGTVIMRSCDTPQLYKGSNVEIEHDENRGCYIAHKITGRFSIGWQEEKNFGDYKALDFLRDND